MFKNLIQKKILYSFSGRIFLTLFSVVLGFVLNTYWGKENLPKASIIYTSLEGQAPHKILFDASNSLNINQGDITYTWSLNGKVIGNTETIKYIFDDVGDYIVSLSLQDKNGNLSTKSVFVLIHPPEKIHSIKDALHFNKYNFIWDNGIKTIKQIPSSVTLLNDSIVNFSFESASTVDIFILDSGNLIRGMWKEGDDVGEIWLKFNANFTEAIGWWTKETLKHKKFNVRMEKVDS